MIQIRICIVGVLIALSSPAMDLKKAIDLNGSWRFEIGDRAEYAGVNYDDSHWDVIRAPGRWEDQGFPGYDGYAWYRRTFILGDDLKEKKLLLLLGQIDDVDQVYLNGHLIAGSGHMPPEYSTAYNQNRIYELPPVFLQFGASNILAIRVYDDMEAGGIINGDLGVYIWRDYPELVADLGGYWRFHTGDDLRWRHEQLDDQDWDRIVVPLRWELQGYEDYDGYAWYRRSVFLDDTHKGETLILALGKIDDIDEVYFNGRRIGGNGHFPARNEEVRNNSCWNRERFYTIPNDLIRWDGENAIAVRTYDAWLDGGIYEGPVGILTRHEYLRQKKSLKEQFWEIFEGWE